MSTKTSTSTQFLNFSDALHHLRWGERVARRTWNAGNYLKVNYAVTPPVIEVTLTNNHTIIPWTHPCEALLAEDWYVLGSHQ